LSWPGCSFTFDVATLPVLFGLAMGDMATFGGCWLVCCCFTPTVRSYLLWTRSRLGANPAIAGCSSCCVSIVGQGPSARSRLVDETKPSTIGIASTGTPHAEVGSRVPDVAEKPPCFWVDFPTCGRAPHNFQTETIFGVNREKAFFYLFTCLGALGFKRRQDQSCDHGHANALEGKDVARQPTE
jgi:hypothetical protein